MQFECRVVGHELVTKKDEQLVKVKLRGAAFQDLKAELLVSLSDREKYPFGATAYLDFSVQQAIPFEQRGGKAK